MPVEMRFLEYFSPQLASSTAELHRYYPKLQNPAVSQHSSKKCVYGLLTSGEAFQSAGASFHFQVSVQVNTAMRAWDHMSG